jgi:hypothetical protein
MFNKIKLALLPDKYFGCGQNSDYKYKSVSIPFGS